MVMGDGLKSQQIKAIRGALNGKKKKLIREVMGDFFFFLISKVNQLLQVLLYFKDQTLKRHLLKLSQSSASH